MNAISKAVVAAVLLVGAGFGAAGAEAQTWYPRTTSTPYATCVRQATEKIEMDYAKLHVRWQQSVATGDASTTIAADRALKLDIALLADC